MNFEKFWWAVNELLIKPFPEIFDCFLGEIGMSVFSVPYMHIIPKILLGKQTISQIIRTLTVKIFDEEQHDVSADVFCSILFSSLSA